MQLGRLLSVGGRCDVGVKCTSCPGRRTCGARACRVAMAPDLAASWASRSVRLASWLSSAARASCGRAGHVRASPLCAPTHARHANLWGFQVTALFLKNCKATSCLQATWHSRTAPTPDLARPIPADSSVLHRHSKPGPASGLSITTCGGSPVLGLRVLFLSWLIGGRCTGSPDPHMLACAHAKALACLWPA